MPENPVVVFDSNVLIPLILKASLSTRLFLRLDAAKWEVAVSPRMQQRPIGLAASLGISSVSILTNQSVLQTTGGGWGSVDESAPPTGCR
jgi:hypothetical protein